MYYVFSCKVRPDEPGDLQVTLSPEATDMANPLFTYRKRVFLSPISTGYTSHILAEAESSNGGEYRWGHYMLTIADCRRQIKLEFNLGNARDRRASLKKINLLIDILTRFRDALTKEANLIEKAK
jgi:hypothetical protein